MIGTQFTGVPAQKGGALEWLSFELAKKFAEKGNKVVYYSVKVEGDGQKVLRKHEKGNKVVYYSVKGPRHETENLEIKRYPSQKTSGVNFNAFVFLNSLRKKFDLIYLTGCSLLPAAYALAKIKKIPLVYHEFNHLPWIRERDFLNSRLSIQSVKKADLVFCPSQGIKKKIIEGAGVMEEKVRVIPNFVNLEEHPKQFPEKKNQMLFVGRMQKEKGLSELSVFADLLEKKLPDWTLRIAGAGEGKLFLRSGKNVEFLGRLEREELLKEFRESSLFIFPSTEEAFGLVLAEAMASFTPPIALNVLGVNEVVSHGETGWLLQKGNVKALAEKATELAENERKRKEFALNGRQRVEEKFELGKSFALIEKELEEPGAGARIKEEGKDEKEKGFGLSEKSLAEPKK